MNSEHILHLRLANQLLIKNDFHHPHEVVSYMGAMQSQTFDMARWAIGARLPGISDRRVIQAIDNAEIVRIHILRPTWHFVAAEDIHWMMELSMPRLRPVYHSYAKMSGTDVALYAKYWPVIERAMRDHNHLTRQQIVEILAREGYSVAPDIVGLLLGFGELDGLVCNGRVDGNKQTFCLLQERIPKPPSLCKEECLEKLARKFFTSHSPATLQDFIWWSGLLISDAKNAVGLIKDDFITETINGREFLIRHDLVIPPKESDSALLLPPFDEMVVSYKDRSDMIEDHHYGKVMTKNGLFSPTVMWNGQIIGSWRKMKKKNKTEIEISFFEKTTKKKQQSFKKAEKAYLDFLTSPA